MTDHIAESSTGNPVESAPGIPWAEEQRATLVDRVPWTYDHIEGDSLQLEDLDTLMDVLHHVEGRRRRAPHLLTWSRSSSASKRYWPTPPDHSKMC
ncbi:MULTISPECIES: hypothetical protein [unclassified Microbacterium]|uniref:hypothetical protein n=1 Tax=unclassified Microbacterium TaxID=2609290 RepID=UPI0021A6EE96|nr:MULTISPECIES: hypothetical protein [unclassified Microbacterium]MCT1364041.1 hypothetical protein [Microbacterium sp. p3-SID131]MCT1375317.1 hypothetical protein [Microbacterium sp. p3-SID337]